MIVSILSAVLSAAPVPAPVVVKAAPVVTEPAPAPAPAPIPKNDWIVVVLGVADGRPVRCWQLVDTVLVPAPQSDVIWQDAKNGHLVRVSSSLLTIQVHNKNWETAFALAEMTESACAALEQRKWKVDDSVPAPTTKKKAPTP